MTKKITEPFQFTTFPRGGRVGVLDEIKAISAPLGWGLGCAISIDDLETNILNSVIATNS